jgi:hypothetical protein|tara:strand:+ start:61 stop:1113 length:1053 start_codon:yes stop_codon:yes gene_type:complete
MASKKFELGEEDNIFISSSGFDITDFQSPIYQYEEGDFDKDTNIKEFYDLLEGMNYAKKAPFTNVAELSGDWTGDREDARKALLKDLEKHHKDRGKEDYNFRGFEKAYAEKDPEKKQKMLENLRTQISPDTHSPHTERGRPFVESDVTEAILRGNLKKPEPGYEGPFGKIGEYFSKNAAARDKMFSMLGSMGREMVKPIQPGQEAAGALIPTLSRGLGKGETEYAAKQAAATKRMLDMASAQQKVNPLQYFSTKMKEAKAMVPQGIEPGSVEEKRWIANYLRSTGIPGQLVDLTSSLESLDIQYKTATTEEDKKRLKDIMDGINRQILDLATQGMEGTTTTGTINYTDLL